MEMWLSPIECTGCGGCSNACPKDAIQMAADDTGFIHPIIDTSLCVDCGLCKKSCPILEKPDIARSMEPSVYAAWSKDPETRFHSTSGGAFSEFAKLILAEGGYIAGAQYTENNFVEHTVVHDLEGLRRLRQSKYIQSEPKLVYREVKKCLDTGKPVAFCGTPCQVAALLKYLKQDPDNLLTIEFICRGVNSPKAYRSWLDEIEAAKGSKAVKVWFKYKENGWNRSPRCTRVDFADGSFQVFSGDGNTFMTGYLGPNLYIRPSCGQCQFNGLPRQSDITLADFWKVQNTLDDDKGTSMILLNSKKAEFWYHKVKEHLISEERSFEEVHAGNGCFSNSVKINPRSGEFLRSLTDNPFSVQLQKYTKEPLLKRILRKGKRLVKRYFRILKEA